MSDELLLVALIKWRDRGDVYHYESRGFGSVDVASSQILGAALRPKGTTIDGAEELADFRSSVVAIAEQVRWFDEPMGGAE